jgi:SpoVK/Ycf46/Vps4 family AAA+-type ATPase
MANKDIFVERGLMFKTGILLYGSPGTGKSSLATAIASYLGCDMIIIDTSTFDKLKINEVTNSIDADDDMYVVLLDEVDTLFKSRDDKDITDDQKKVVDKLLAFLDSAQSPNNVVFVATTNYIDNLDKAVRRKGRFDKEFEILDISVETAKRMCQGFNLDKETTDEIITSRMAKGDRINPADLQVEIISRMRAKDINYDADMEILTSMEEKEERDKADAEALKDISKNEKKEEDN